jgi:transcriptional regulator of aromatic amino acid metabolism
VFVVALASTNLNTSVTRTGPTDRVREHRAMRRRVTRAERAEIVRLYESGLATRAVAKRLAVSKTCVLEILKAEGVTVRPRGNPGHSRQ